MVCYCCVKGCSNNSNNKKKDPSVAVSFHTFPSNQELRQKWLRAIGRPNWMPPAHARICSAHFTYDQISQDGVRTRIVDHACPVNALPPNSNFEATNLEVCRICLADDVRMYSTHTGKLKTCLQSIIGFSENYNIEGLPQFVCYLCAALLMKCYQLVEKSMIAQVTLLDIFAENGEITKCLLRKQNRKVLNLNSSLQNHVVQSSTIVDFKYNEEQSIFNEDQNINSEEDLKLENQIEEINKSHDYKTEKVFHELLKIEETNPIIETVNEEMDSEDDDFTTVDEAIVHDEDIIDNNDSKCEDMFVLGQINEEKEQKSRPKVKRKSKETEKGNKAKRTKDGLTLDEIAMQEHFNIVKLSIEEQVEEWSQSLKRRVKSDNSHYIHSCETCGKMFVHQSSLRSHIKGHDPSRGPAKCSVCKLRFKSDACARSHARYTHGKKFLCKTCPKVFNSVAMAKKHQRGHAGYKYRCPHCSFTSAHASARGAHVRAIHASCACARCGRACASLKGLRVHEGSAHGGSVLESEKEHKFKCEQCDLSFATEAARRVHTLTSNRHRKKPDLCDPTPQDPAVKTACRTCGVQFNTRSELVSHVKSEHPKKKVTSWSLPDDCYPKQCEHCEVTVNNRSEHWSHVRRQHPGHKDTYRPVITAVCDTCGKGFQNTTKLHLHELRHRSPTVRCEFCPKLFYDKFLLATHLSIHSEARPHRCRTCGRGFKLRGNLERHYRVHSDIATYECTLCGKKFKYSTSLNLHVRSVHYKIPPPPRKKRSKKIVSGND